MDSIETGLSYSVMSIVLLVLLSPREPYEGRTRLPVRQRSSSRLEPTSRGHTKVKETKISLVVKSHNQNSLRTCLLATTGYFQARCILSVSLSFFAYQDLKHSQSLGSFTVRLIIQITQASSNNHIMSDRIPGREDSVRRAEEPKDQFGNPGDLYDDVREVVDTEDPLAEDYQLPEVIARKSAENMEVEELANVKEELRTLKQAHQTSEQALQNEIEMHKTEIKRLQTEIKRLESERGDERIPSLQEIQQLQHFLFSKMLTIQNDQNISLPMASGNRLHFKRQQLSISQDTLAQWIQGPLDSLTNSADDTPNSAETYQQVLGSLIILQSSSDIQDKESLLECMEKLQTWLTKACKDRTSILGMALARVIKVIQEGPQSDPWFSTDEFDASRTIDSRNSELPQTTSIIADGCPGIVLVVQGTDIQVCASTDVFMRQQMSCGMQLVFNEALNLPDLQLLADSFPHIDRWAPLCLWAHKVGRINYVERLGRVYEPEKL